MSARSEVDGPDTADVGHRTGAVDRDDASRNGSSHRAGPVAARSDETPADGTPADGTPADGTPADRPTNGSRANGSGGRDDAAGTAGEDRWGGTGRVELVPHGGVVPPPPASGGGAHQGTHRTAAEASGVTVTGTGGAHRAPAADATADATTGTDPGRSERGGPARGGSRGVRRNVVGSTSVASGTDAASPPSGPIVMMTRRAGRVPTSLDGRAVELSAAAEVAVVATVDARGQRDVSVLAGPTCVVRVLDEHRLAFPDEGTAPRSRTRANLEQQPGVGLLLIAPGDGAPGRRAMHVNGSAEVVPAAALREHFPALPPQPVTGHVTDAWVVVDVDDVQIVEGDEAPPLAHAGPAAVSAPTPSRGLPRHAAPAPAPSPRRTGVSAALLALVVLLAVGAGASAIGLGRASRPTPPPAPATPAAPTGPATLFGHVVAVPDPTSAVVDLGGRSVIVDIVGLDSAVIPPCALPGAQAFAEQTLSNQDVTLVPDPTNPNAAGRDPSRVESYAVLGTQLSYTDAAIMQGWAPAAGASRYRAVFDREQAEAKSQGKGMWGSACSGER